MYHVSVKCLERFLGNGPRLKFLDDVDADAEDTKGIKIVQFFPLKNRRAKTVIIIVHLPTQSQSNSGRNRRHLLSRSWIFVGICPGISIYKCYKRKPCIVYIPESLHY